MIRPHRFCGVIALIIALAVPFASRAGTAEPALVAALARLAPAANPNVIRLALEATSCAAATGMGTAERLAVIDYSRPSSEPRLWVFDLKKRSLIFEELVAHGKNTGENYARSFSNKMNSLATSIGLYRTGTTYQGSNGYSLRMDGLDPGFNDKAKERAIVIHGAPYVSRNFAETHGRIGRSWGCPAVRTAIAKKLIDIMKDGQFVFSYYPDSEWLKSSPFLNCSVSPTRTVEHGTPGTLTAGM
ncbi:murein L,D-transpeptidase catalytic domain family protein [Govanella unica]|uniref:Murein L,D-transpeptidase catalytic domain family protein n=1 Tax=Govanella unica TaxID=2975056 RepID=A0A9X3U2B5_9PROT|nr:murein L,D-transpeptidase catalytic domain family protein [Govania unica]MDA5195129.1 murein L,D-transpeptidase catalytic domain family protein [Govania unica]